MKIYFGDKESLSTNPGKLSEMSNMNVKVKLRSIVQACTLALASSVAVASPAIEADQRSISASGIEDSQAVLRYAEDLASKQGLQVVYHGSEQLKDQFGRGTSKLALQLDSDKQIIITDSLDKDLAMQLLARGNFVVMVGRMSSNPAKSAMAMLDDLAETGTLQQSKAAYDVDQPHLTADRGDGQWVEENVSAYSHSLSYSSSFHTVEPNPVVGVAAAIQWARDQVMRSPTERAIAKVDLPFQFMHSRILNTNCLKDGILAGNINYVTNYSKGMNDGNPNYDYWSASYSLEMVPKYATTKQWKNVSNLIRSDKNAINPNWKLLDYGPVTTQGAQTVGVSLSIGDFGTGWSYSIPDVKIINYSNKSTGVAKWSHQVTNQSSDTAKSSWMVKPGTVFETSNNHPRPYDKILEVHEGVFVANTGARVTCQTRWND